MLKNYGTLMPYFFSNMAFYKSKSATTPIDVSEKFMNAPDFVIGSDPHAQERGYP